MARTHIGTTLISPLDGTLAAGGNKITGLANGTVATDAAAFGQIFTGFQAPIQTISTTATNTTGTSFVTTNSSALITLTNSAHRVKISVNGNILVADNTVTIYVTLARNGSNLAGGNGFALYNIATGSSQQVPCAITYIDTPASGAALTYAVYIRGDVAGKNVAWGSSGVTTVIVLEEIV